MADRIIFRMAAWTDAAGKYDPGAPQDGNEDNYYIDDNLSDDTPSHMVADEDIVLSDCGMLMAVADRMGGMNAGEVASQIAHDTVAEYFAPGRITPRLAETHEKRSRYMEQVVREADCRIKKDSRHNDEHANMGSTLIMAWLVGNELSLTWIGDSRAYRFNPRTGIEPLSKDHSYVQELVNKGIITYEQTFEHPQGNVVTRSLGDRSQKACPESRLYKVSNGDIILLCSDGLSGVLRDRKSYDENGELFQGENLEDIIRIHSSSMRECREALWAAAERAEWYDNVTAILCQIRSGAGEYVTPANDGRLPRPKMENSIGKTFDGITIKIPRKRFLLFLVLFLIVAGAGVIGFLSYNSMGMPTASDSLTVATDTMPKAVDKDAMGGEVADEVLEEQVPDSYQDQAVDETSKKKKSKNKEGDTANVKKSKIGFHLERVGAKKQDNDRMTPIEGESELTPVDKNRTLKDDNERDSTRR